MARRWRSLVEEACELFRHIKVILDEVAASLVAVYGVGYETAGQLLVTAATTPSAATTRSPSPRCAAPPRSRRRPGGRTGTASRGGDRNANSALWTIVLVQMGSHPPTQAYVERRTAEGLSKPDIMRCLKRSFALEFFPLIQTIAAPSTLREGGHYHRHIAA